MSEQEKVTPLIQAEDKDPFDLEKARFTQDYDKMAGTKKHITTIPVTRPHRQEFIRVHPQYSYETLLFRCREERTVYWVAPEFRDEVTEDLKPVVLFPYVNRKNDLKFWPIGMSEEGRSNDWNDSALEAAIQARDKWVRVASNTSLGAYEVHLPVSVLEEPEWPDLTLQEMVRIAFKHKLISDPSHPRLKSLRGE